MADEVETTTPAAETAAPPVPATPATPDVDALVKAAEEKTRREAQAAKDREVARLHQEYQQKLKAEREQATARMRQLGDKDADGWAAQTDVLDKARKYEQIEAEAQRVQAWNDYAATVAKAYGLDPSDKRLANPASADDFVEKARKAMAEDVDSERKKLLEKAADEKRRATDARIASGELDTLGGKPAGGAGTGDVWKDYQQELAANRGKGNAVGAKIRAKYRELGLNV